MEGEFKNVMKIKKVIFTYFRTNEMWLRNPRKRPDEP